MWLGHSSKLKNSHTLLPVFASKISPAWSQAPSFLREKSPCTRHSVRVRLHHRLRTYSTGEETPRWHGDRPDHLPRTGSVRRERTGHVDDVSSGRHHRGIATSSQNCNNLLRLHACAQWMPGHDGGALLHSWPTDSEETHNNLVLNNVFIAENSFVRLLECRRRGREREREPFSFYIICTPGPKVVKYSNWNSIWHQNQYLGRLIQTPHSKLPLKKRASKSPARSITMPTFFQLKTLNISLSVSLQAQAVFRSLSGKLNTAICQKKHQHRTCYDRPNTCLSVDFFLLTRSDWLDCLTIHLPKINGFFFLLSHSWFILTFRVVCFLATQPFDMDWCPICFCLTVDRNVRRMGSWNAQRHFREWKSRRSAFLCAMQLDR